MNPKMSRPKEANGRWLSEIHQLLPANYIPKIGEMVAGKQLGRISGHHFVWEACEGCGKPRWKEFRTPQNKNNRASRYCHSCAISIARRTRNGERNPRVDNGYRMVFVSSDSPFYIMSKCGWVKEHRLVIAQYLGRFLVESEHVHHRNGDKLDNRLENLELLNPSNHVLREQYCTHCPVKDDVRLLKWHIKELNNRIKEMEARGVDVS